jgi:AcrR family transcriptional regulator
MTGKTRVLLDRPTRRAAILRAAAAAFAERGFADTSMDDVAGAAGITRLIVYRHFDSKEALYAAVLQHVRDRLAEEGSAGVRARRERRGACAAGRRTRRPGRRHAAAPARGARAAVRAYADEFREQVITYSEELMKRRARAGARAEPVGRGDARVVRVRRAVALARRRRPGA